MHCVPLYYCVQPSELTCYFVVSVLVSSSWTPRGFFKRNIDIEGELILKKKYSVLNISISTGIFCLVLWNLGWNRSLLALACLHMRQNWGKYSDDTTRTVIIAYFHVFIASSLIATILFCLKYNVCFLLSLHKDQKRSCHL